MNNNIFVITRLGQLRNAHAFIEQYKAKNNILIILYDNKNMDLQDNLRKNIYPNDFKYIKYIELPDKPLSTTRAKCKDIFITFKNTLDELTKKYKVKNLFLCNADNYYKYFECISKELNLSLILFEEGLTTYRTFAPIKERLYNLNDIKSATKRLLKNIKLSIVSLLGLMLKIASWIIHKDLFGYIKTMRIPKKYRYGLIDEFEQAYVCFPEKMRELNSEKRIKAINKLDFFIDRNIDKKLLKKIQPKTILFIHQKYVPYDVHFEILLRILIDQGIKEITFKFHPKEEYKSYFIHLKHAMEKYPQIKINILDGFDHVPVENLIVTGKISKVIGLTTSALTYTPIINPNVEVISIAKSYKRLCESKEYNIDARALELFYRDYDAFDTLFDVKQI